MRHLFSFLKIVLAVWVGLAVFLGSFAVLLLVGSFSAQRVFSSREEGEGSDHGASILKISLQNTLQEELKHNSPVEHVIYGILDIDQPLYLMDILSAIEHAATDDNILGISLHIGGIKAGLPQLEELNCALVEFKKSNKFVYAYADFLSEADYYVASAADTLMVYPSAWVEFNGFSSSFVFFKGALDALKIKPQVFKVGDFKGAVESYTQEKLSDKNRLQNQILIDKLYTNYLDNVSASHVLSAEELREVATHLKVQDAETAYKESFVSHLGYMSDYDTLLRKRIDSQKEALPYTSLRAYTQNIPKVHIEDKIAVIVAEGVIGQEEDITYQRFIRALTKARKNEHVKAIVLRINSPGGAFYDADKMWHEVMRTKQTKPIIASMSNLAASGGYYLAMACDKIVAYPSTITGSIGVFAISLELSAFARNFGVTFDKVQSAPYAHLGDPFFEMTPEEKTIIQAQVGKIYETFVNKAAKSRGLKQTQVHKVAQGRVWTGAQALAQDLVDQNGNFKDALNLAAEMANITDYALIYYTLQESTYALVLQEFILNHQSIRDLLVPLQEAMKPMFTLSRQENIQARMLHTFAIH